MTPIAPREPVSTDAPRVLGEDAGRYVVGDDFDAPMHAEALDRVLVTASVVP